VSTPENQTQQSAEVTTQPVQQYWAKQKGLKHPDRKVRRPRYDKELKKLVGQVNVTCAVSKDIVRLVEEQCLQDGITRSDLLRAALIREVAFRKLCRDNGATPLVVSHLTPTGQKPEKAVKAKPAKPSKQAMVAVPKETLDQISFVFKALNG
jgi:hypothetical protein